MVRVTYSKEFLTGHLKGLTVKASFRLPTLQDAGIAMNSLNKLTEKNPGSDAVTGSLFWVYNIGCESA